MNKDNLFSLLKNKKLKVTPQRIAILDALFTHQNHPTAENIKNLINKDHPNIAIGTIYKVLDTFVEYGIINKVKTEKDIMRYDAILSNHHHLYCSKSDHIEDYEDENLNALLIDYFTKQNIPNFNIKDIKLQIIGEFKNE